MPNTITSLNLFLASPSDTKSEREAVQRICEEFNRTQGRYNEIQIQCVLWENDVYPDVGDSPQNLINDQIGKEYDIFVGIFSTRFGSPTSNAQSGTQEEFQRALNAYYKQELIGFFAYFSNVQVSVSEIDPEQISLVQQFRKKMENEGIISTYSNIEEFETFFRIHLSKCIYTWLESRKKSNDVKQDKSSVHEHTEHTGPFMGPSQSNSDFVEEDEEDAGYIDLIEEYERKVGRATSLIESFNYRQETLAKTVEETINELNDIKENSDKTDARRTFKRSVNRLAQQMRLYAENIDESAPDIQKSFQEGIDAFSKAVQIQVVHMDCEDIPDIEQECHDLETTLDKLAEQQERMYETVKVLPKFTTEFGRSRKKFLESTASFVRTLRSIKVMVEKLREYEIFQ